MSTRTTRTIDGEELMLITAACKETGLSQTTIRKYIERGLVQTTQIRQGTITYQCFDVTAVLRIKIIKIFREMDVSLEQIKEIFDSSSDSHNAILDQLIDRLEARKRDIDQQIEFCKQAREVGMKVTFFAASDVEDRSLFIQTTQEVLQKVIAQTNTAELEKTISVLKKEYLSLNNYPFYSPQMQAFMENVLQSHLMVAMGSSQLLGEQLGCKEKCYLLFCIALLLLGEGVISQKIALELGDGSTQRLVRAATYCFLSNVDQLCIPFRVQYKNCANEDERTSLVALLNHKVDCWLKDISPYQHAKIQEPIDLTVFIDAFLRVDDGLLPNTDIVEFLLEEIKNISEVVPL